MPYPCRPLIASKAIALKSDATGSLSCDGFALLVVPCDSRDLMWLSGEASPGKWAKVLFDRSSGIGSIGLP